MSIDKTIDHARKHDLSHLEARIQDVHASLQAMARGSELTELLHIIRRPGWTSVAEYALVLHALENLATLSEHIRHSKRALVTISQTVGSSNPMPG